MNKIKNPILPGFYPDPSICRAGTDYYMVTSTFAYFPGIPIFYSCDLANWKQIGSVLTRDTQLPLQGCGHSEGIYAPTIRYHDGIFYVITTNISCGGNFIVAAEDPSGPWSDPIWLGERAKGIDPSLFFDEDGSCWYIGQRERTGGSAYFGDCEIWMQEIDLPELKRRLRSGQSEVQKVTTQAEKQAYNAETLFLGDEIVLSYGFARKSIWSEGPHIYKKDGYYYLIHAEMGTEQAHSVVVARSRTLTGPYEYDRKNPILTHRHLGKHYPVTCVGHADLVDDPSGNWYLVALGCRPEQGYTLMGRETFLANVVWEDEWPVVNPGIGRLEEEVLLPEALSEYTEREYASDRNYLMLRNPEQRTAEDRTDGSVRLYMKAVTLKDRANPAYLCVRQPARSFWTETEVVLHGHPTAEQDRVLQETGLMEHAPERCHLTETDCAGLAYVQSNEAHMRLECFRQEKELALRVVSCSGGTDQVLAQCSLGRAERKTQAGAAASNTQRVALRICVCGLKADFQWKNCENGSASVDNHWETILSGADLRHMSTECAGGFTGCTVGMYASGNGRLSDGYADFYGFAVHLSGC